ncbi:HD domain-containing protein [Tenacibaculum halocynthiae]|uniref:HD domain-containing protein n=1 Tax=Tenacibaculum halocynthiae TaxID=1254437 RepID=UPI003D65E678
MTQELYQNAIKFAGEKHCNQKVPGTNSNYLLHLSNVAMEILVAYSFKSNFDINYAIQVALLHDTIEDTDTKFEELKDKFGESIANAVQALSKNDDIALKEDRMLDSLNRINKQEKEVGMVKLADRITNLQTPPNHWNKEKIIKYWEEAKIISSKLNNKNKYLNERLKSKITEYEGFFNSF